MDNAEREGMKTLRLSQLRKIKDRIEGMYNAGF